MGRLDVPAPAHLSPEAKIWWGKFVAGWSLDDAALLILQSALEAFDRMRGAQKILKRDGLTLKGRAHPCTVVERDARLAMLRALRSLNLDLEPLRDRPGRPPGRH
jgi:phage terminase small subunit